MLPNEFAPRETTSQVLCIFMTIPPSVQLCASKRAKLHPSPDHEVCVCTFRLKFGVLSAIGVGKEVPYLQSAGKHNFTKTTDPIPLEVEQNSAQC